MPFFLDFVIDCSSYDKGIVEFMSDSVVRSLKKGGNPCSRSVSNSKVEIWFYFYNSLYFIRCLTRNWKA